LTGLHGQVVVASTRWPTADEEHKMTLFKQPVKNSVSEKKKGDG
jgi:hypothetical protein